MSEYYRPQRVRNIFDPASAQPFKLSRSKIELFMKCPRCFYLDRRLGVGQPPGYPFSLNSAVDTLLKKEFDAYRQEQKAHPLMVQFGVDAVPFLDPRMDTWRDSLHYGIQTHHLPTNLLLTGGVDDVWVTPGNQLVIVDYKATSKAKEVTITEDWQIGYRRQMEIYTWLFQRNGFDVHPEGYFVYCNGRSSAPRFDQRLDFDVRLLPYLWDNSWVEQTIQEISSCLNSDDIPIHKDDCDFCAYFGVRLSLVSQMIRK